MHKPLSFRTEKLLDMQRFRAFFLSATLALITSTSDVNRAAEFYRDAFDWEIVPSKDSGYLTARVDGEPVATIAAYEEGDAEQEAPWLLSMSVRDVDKTATKLLSSGGQVLEQAFDLRGLALSKLRCPT